MKTAELFITRKRKKWKFAHFSSWPNCFSIDEVDSNTWKDFFPQQQPLAVEVGAGTADLSVGLAQKYPGQNFVAIDIKSDRLYTGAKFCLENHVDNIAFVRAHLSHIGDLFEPAGVSELWITFPDPFPRKKQAKHRLTHAAFLSQYQKLLGEKGILRFKTDNRELFLWSLEQFVAEGWRITELSFDLHESGLSQEYKITTAYERRFMAEGVPINFLSARPPAG